MNYKKFLTEIYMEEIPYKNIRYIAIKFYENFIFELNKKNILFSKPILFDSPKRIAIQINKINNFVIIKKQNIRGPSLQNSYHHGKLTYPALQWLKKFNIHIKNVKIFKNKKGSWLLHEYNEKKIIIKNILPDIILSAIKNIPLKKTMKWNEYDIQFIRPIRNIIILLDDTFIPFKKYGIPSQKYLYGSISTIPKKIKINHVKEYENILYKFGKVIAKFNIRKKKIKYQSKKLANKLCGQIKFNHTLLEEITCLVEWPNILYGKFKKKFLHLPQEILIYVLQNIQKYFPIYHQKNNKLTEKFIIISNINFKKNTQIISGNERVLNARLSDIDFFIKNDQKIKFKKYFLQLNKIIFHEKLGTMLQKTKRLIKLMEYTIPYTKENFKNSIQCTLLSKCDLKTNMVYEFPELKGIIGMEYALNNGISENIALAIKEQYQPKFSGDQLPSNILGCILSIIDKIDTIVGFFLIGQQPKNDNDPFYLRRLTIGIIRIIIEKKIKINLLKLIIKSIKLYQIKNKKINVSDTIMQFIINRLSILYQKKYNSNIIKSVLSIHNNNLNNIDYKIKLLSKLQNNIFFKELILIYKRISNLIKKTNIIIKKKYIIYDTLIENIIEKKLYIMTKINYSIIDSLLKDKKYENIIEILLYFNNPIKNFLNTVSIKKSEDKIQINRILLLNKIQELFLKIADFEKI